MVVVIINVIASGDVVVEDVDAVVAVVVEGVVLEVVAASAVVE
jgi:hypothetical protein